MFSEMIQSLLNSGGKSAAIKRASQLNGYVNNINKRTQQQSIQSSLDTIYPPNTNSVQSFEKVLANSTASNFGSLLLNPKSLNVNGNIYGQDIDTSGFQDATLRRAI